MKITLENFEKENINLLNYDMLSQKNLGENEPNDKYFELLNRYKYFFELYIKEILPLELIDSNMSKSELNFDKVKEENMDFYQRTSSMGLSYIYLRNNLFVEKLSSDDIEFILSKNEFDDEVRNFIKRTYKMVINPFEDEKIIFYGPENSSHMCNSTDVVVGIRYDEFLNNGLSDNEFEKRFFNQKRLIKQLSSLLEIAGESEFKLNVRCIHYNEFSVNKPYDKQV